MASHFIKVKNLGKKVLFDRKTKAGLYFSRKYGHEKINEFDILIDNSTSDLNRSSDLILQVITKLGIEMQYQIFLAIEPQNYDYFQKLLNQYDLTFVTLIKKNDRKYVDALLKSKYIINATKLPTYYIKNENQVILSTINNVVIDEVGILSENGKELGNDMRILAMSDVVLYPNEDTAKKIKSGLKLDEIYEGNYIIAQEETTSLQYLCQLDEKENCEVFYFDFIEKQLNKKNNIEYLQEILSAISKHLISDQKAYITLPKKAKENIDLSVYSNIFYLEKGISKIQFLQNVDYYITDRSKRLFDFYQYNRPIVIFEHEFNDIDCKFDEVTKNMPRSQDIEDCFEQCNLQTNIDYKRMYEEYGNHIHQTNIEVALKKLVYNIDDSRVINHNVTSKKTIVIYTGNLTNQKLEEEIEQLFEDVNFDDYRIIILSYKKNSKENLQILEKYKDRCTFMSIAGRKTITLKEAFAHHLYYYYNVQYNWVVEAINNIYRRELKRLFNNLKIDYCIHFSGIEKHILQLFNQMECPKILYIHTQVVNDDKEHKKAHLASMYRAIKDYNHCIVSASQKNNLSQIINKVSKLKKDCEKVDFISNITNSEFESIITENKKIIVSRNNDQIDLLLKAFEKSNQENTKLVIIANREESYQNLLLKLENNKDCVVLYQDRYLYKLMKNIICYVDCGSQGIISSLVIKMIHHGKSVLALNHPSNAFYKLGFGTMYNDENDLCELLKKVCSGELKTIYFDNRPLIIKILIQISILIKQSMYKVLKKMRKYIHILLKKSAPIYSKLIRKNPKMILFISFHGRGYSDNPMAIHQYLLNDEQYKDYKFIWAIKKYKQQNLDIPRSKQVEYASISYLYYLARAKYWVSNCKLPGYVHKEPNQVYIQTWHGTPLKRLAHDIEVPEGTKFYRSGMSFEEMANTYTQDVKKYNYMVSPSKFTTEVFQSAFQINRERLIETGYPRNDCLSNFNEKDVLELKQKYDIPLDKKVILYAPTWRDNSFSKKGYTFSLEVDFDRWYEYLKDEYVVIFKPHYLIVSDFDVEKYKGFVYSIDATADISSLYIISDVLITDYSSVFFDFAILNRPIYFYMYDLESYRSELRGFYIDIYTDLPGDIYEDESLMLDAIAQNNFQSDRLEKFNQRFNNMEDGNASKRVIDMMFNVGNNHEN